MNIYIQIELFVGSSLLMFKLRSDFLLKKKKTMESIMANYYKPHISAVPSNI